MVACRGVRRQGHTWPTGELFEVCRVDWGALSLVAAFVRLDSAWRRPADFFSCQRECFQPPTWSPSTRSSRCVLRVVADLTFRLVSPRLSVSRSSEGPFHERLGHPCRPP